MRKVVCLVKTWICYIIIPPRTPGGILLSRWYGSIHCIVIFSGSLMLTSARIAYPVRMRMRASNRTLTPSSRRPATRLRPRALLCWGLRA